MLKVEVKFLRSSRTLVPMPTSPLASRGLNITTGMPISVHFSQIAIVFLIEGGSGQVMITNSSSSETGSLSSKLLTRKVTFPSQRFFSMAPTPISGKTALVFLPPYPFSVRTINSRASSHHRIWSPSSAITGPELTSQSSGISSSAVHRPLPFFIASAVASPAWITESSRLFGSTSSSRAPSTASRAMASQRKLLRRSAIFAWLTICKEAPSA
mmetsp:Transcript_22608/g.37799  ORF Transcript_22608/g.37799 Transcript_22608/m.37799 type:complete len:213 (-) Transcript_22608:210-848(-)